MNLVYSNTLAPLTNNIHSMYDNSKTGKEKNSTEKKRAYKQFYPLTQMNERAESTNGCETWSVGKNDCVSVWGVYVCVYV